MLAIYSELSKKNFGITIDHSLYLWLINKSAKGGDVKQVCDRNTSFYFELLI